MINVLGVRSKFRNKLNELSSSPFALKGRELISNPRGSLLTARELIWHGLCYASFVPQAVKNKWKLIQGPMNSWPKIALQDLISSWPSVGACIFLGKFGNKLTRSTLPKPRMSLSEILTVGQDYGWIVQCSYNAKCEDFLWPSFFLSNLLGGAWKPCWNLSNVSYIQALQPQGLPVNSWPCMVVWYQKYLTGRLIQPLRKSNYFLPLLNK